MVVKATKQESSPDTLKKPKNQGLTVIPKTIRGDTYMVMADAAIEPEDEFINLYYTANQAGGIALKPPFDPKVLKHLVTHNNTLAQCIETMSVNIDGTGYEFVNAENEEEEADKAEVKKATSFFNEPFPGMSFTAIRRMLRDDLECVGYAFLEVLRSLSGDIVGLRNVEPTTVRMVRLDDPVPIKKKIMRDGEEIEITYIERERRYMQLLNGVTKVYFREFGASRHLHRHEGIWEKEGAEIPAAVRASELLMFGVMKDHQTPYYVPRWINQLPSVLGSRKAEEQNLEFFDAGGMPPAIVFIQGGSMVGPAADQLRTYLSSQNKNKGRAIVVELESTSGSIEATAGVTAKVERFGSQGTDDAMFQSYDEAAEEHVRMGFRLPALFLGKAADMNFATAQTAYMVAEAQVFQPERDEFDDRINKTIMDALGLKKIRMRSNPIVLKSAGDQIKAIELAQSKIDGEDMINEINKVSGLTLRYSKEAEEKNNPLLQMKPNERGTPGFAETKPTPGAGKEPAANDAGAANRLAKKWAFMLGKATYKMELTREEEIQVANEVKRLKGIDLVHFNVALAGYANAHPHAHEE